VFAIAACGGAASPSPSAVGSPSPSAIASPAPSPSSSPSPAPSPSAAASAAVIGRTGTVDIADEGFRITLPDGWRAIDLDEDSISAMADLFPAGSDIGKLLQEQAGSFASAGVKLFAVDPRPDSIENGVAPNVNVIVQPRPEGLSVELLGSLAKAQLEALDAMSGVTVTTETLPAGPAVRADYSVAQTLADGSAVEAIGRQYYLTSDTSLFIVTMTGGSEDLTAAFDAMAQSIEID
jgi:hypothetical protein